MSAREKAGAVLMALCIAGGGQLMAADSADVDRLARDAKAVGREFAREGERIADNAVDFANQVADNFTEAYEQAKEDAKKAD